MPEPKRVRPKNRSAWRKWLGRNHATCLGVWLVFDKKSANATRLAYADSVEEALCFGWIDARLQGIDDRTYQQWFTPRKPGSTWSKLNKTRVENLTAAGQMHPAGLAAIDRAKADGSWTSLDRVEALQPPDDLAAAFAKNPSAKRFFETLSPSARKIVLHNVNAAKRPDTRAKRIAEALDWCARGLHPVAAFREALQKRRAARNG